MMSLKNNKSVSSPPVTNYLSLRGDKNSRCLAKFENCDLLACLIFPQCQPKVDKKLNLRLKKHLRRDILLRLYICAEARPCLRDFLEGSDNNEK